MLQWSTVMRNDGVEFRHPPMSHSVRHRKQLALDSGLRLAILPNRKEEKKLDILYLLLKLLKYKTCMFLQL